MKNEEHQALVERVSKAEKGLIRLEGRVDGHEAVCAERYDRIISSIKSVDNKLQNLSLSKLVVIMTIVLGCMIGILKFMGL